MMRLKSMFGCMSVTTGVKVALTLLLMSNVFYLATTVISVILQVGAFDLSANVGLRIFNAGFCLLTLPFIFAGFYGIAQNNDLYLRGCLSMLSLGFILDLIFIAVFLAYEDDCTSLPLVLLRHGHAFACGVVRMMSIAFVVLLTFAEVYVLCGIWSLCEEIKGAQNESNFKKLISRSIHADGDDSDNPYLHTRHLRRAGAAYGATGDAEEPPKSMGWAAFREAAPTPQRTFEEAFGPDGAETSGRDGRASESLPVPPHMREAYESGALHPSVMNFLTPGDSSNNLTYAAPPRCSGSNVRSKQTDPENSHRAEGSPVQSYSPESWVERPITGPPQVREGLTEVIPGEVRYTASPNASSGSPGDWRSSPATRAISSDLLRESAAAWSSPSAPRSLPTLGGRMHKGMPPWTGGGVDAARRPAATTVVLDPVRVTDLDRSQFAYRGLQPLKSSGIGSVLATSAGITSSRPPSPRGDSSMPSEPGKLGGEFKPTNLVKAPPGPEYQPPLQRHV